MRNGWIRRAAFALATTLALLSAGGCTFLLPQEEEMLAPPLVATKEVTYKTTPVVRGDVIEEKRGSGSFRSGTTYTVCFESGGTLSNIEAVLGTDVKEGDVLLEMTSKDLQYTYDTACIRFEKQQLQYSKISGSYNKQLADYDMKLAQMELDRLEEELEGSRLRAPISGRITYMKEMKVGDYISAYTDVITIADPNNLYAVVTGESAYYFINGRDVTVKIKGESYAGKCVQSPDDDPNVMELKTDQAYAVFEVYDVPAETKTIGREANVSMVSESRTNVLTIPASVLHEYGDRTYVQVLKDGVKEERDIVVGLKANNMYEVISGLEEGEEIIIS